MKKIICAICLIGAILSMSACSTNQPVYDYAIISFPDGTAACVEIDQWRYCTSAQKRWLEVTAIDKTVYMVDSTNCVLVDE